MSAAFEPGPNHAHDSRAGIGYSDHDMKTDEAHLRLDESRRELKDLFDPPADPANRGEFSPRSKIMRSLTGNGGLALLAVGAGGLLLAKPKLVMHFLRMIPVGALARMAAAKFMAGRG
jgi:hypothetical protein